MGESIRLVGMSAEVYYAPQVVAHQAGFFEDEGLEVDFAVTDIPGVVLTVARGEADFALCGMWQPWLYIERLGMRLSVFAAVNQQVPIMLFGRVPAAAFDWASLDGGALLHTSTGATSPWCALQALLHAKQVDLSSLRLVIGFDPPEACALFKSGFADAIELFGQSAVPFLADSELHLLVNWELDLGRIPWSVYFAPPERLRQKREQAIAFTRALGRAQRWLAEHDADEITALVAPWHKGVDEAAIRLLVGAYLEQRQWPEGPAVEPDSVERWRSYLVRAGLLTGGLPYAEIVDEEIAAAATAESAAGRLD